MLCIPFVQGCEHIDLQTLHSPVARFTLQDRIWTPPRLQTFRS